MAARPGKTPAIAIALALFAATPAAATVVEVPLPELAGTFSCSDPAYIRCFQTIAVHLPTIPSVIHSVSLHVRGTTSLATVQCDTGVPHPQGTSLEVDLYEPGQSSNLWYAWHVNEASGVVDYTQPFEAYPVNNTWAFLLDGSAELHLTYIGYSAIPECLVVGPSDSTTLDDVTLLIDGEFPTPARGFSWGRLKRIYR